MSEPSTTKKTVTTINETVTALATPLDDPGASLPVETSLPPEKRVYTQVVSTDEAKNYDFAAARPPGKKTNILESIGHLVKGCLGAGVVSIHASYKDLGLWPSLFLTVILGLLVSYCMFILVRSAQKIYGRLQIPKLSYPDLAEATLSIGPFKKLRKFKRCFRYAVDVTIAIDLFGSCCVYLVVMARSLKQLVAGTETIDSAGLRWYILYLMIPCILLCWILELKYLAPFSIVGDIFICIVSLSTIYYGLKNYKASPFDTKAFPLFKSAHGLFQFLGACVFSMEGVGVSMAVENKCMSIVILMVMVVGFFGYWGFGEEAKSPVTVNFPFSPFSVTLKVLMAIMTFLTFGINFWVPFDLVYFYIRRRHNPQKNWFWERFYRALIIIGITIITLIFPDVSAFIGLLGAFCLSNMGFIYPAFIELCLDWENPGLGRFKWRLLKAIAICGFGVILCILGTYFNAVQLVENVYGNPQDKLNRILVFKY